MDATSNLYSTVHTSTPYQRGHQISCDLLLHSFLVTLLLISNFFKLGVFCEGICPMTMGLYVTRTCTELVAINSEQD